MTPPPPTWTPPERALWTALREGRTLDLSTGAPDSRAIRAQALTELAFTPPDPTPGHTPRLRLVGAHVTGRLDLSAGQVNVPLSFKGCRFDEPIVLDQAELSSLDLDDSRLPGLEAESVRINTWFGMRHAQVDGEIWMFNARVGGTVDFAGTVAEGHLTAGGSVVDGSVRLTGTTVRGETRWRGCRIAGDLDIAGAELHRPGATALTVTGTVIDGSLLAHGLTVHGEANLVGVRVGGTLALVDVTLDHRPPDGWSLLLIEAEARLATLRPTPASTGRISLRDARFGRFVDDVKGWPDDLGVELDGFVYERLSHRSTDVERPTIEERLAWLRRQATASGTGFSPAPYELLAASLRNEGFEQEAREVLRTKERLRHRALGRLAGAWGAAQDAVVGFGFLPARALAWLTALLLTGTAYFAAAGPPAALKPDETPTWDPLLYTLDLIIPIITLGHEPTHDPTGPDKAVALALTIAGWVLVTTTVAGISRTLKRP